MYARVTTFPGLAPERIKATLAEFRERHLPELEQQPGYRGVWAGVDSLDALRATDQLAVQARAAAVSTAGLDRERPPVIDRYELVLQQEPVSA